MKVLGTVLAAFVAVGGLAFADATSDDAKQHYEKGLAAYALGNYSDAALEYEKAFSLKPDPALLYDAAQAHRLAGDQQRALQLYTNYLSVFGRHAPKSDDVNRHIAELKAAIDAQKRAQHSPPTDVAPMGRDGRAATAAESRVPPPASEPPPPIAPTPRASATTTSVSPATPPPTPSTPEPTAPAANAGVDLTARAPEKPVYKKAWFWGVVGAGIAAVALGVGLGVGLGSKTVAPTPSMGSVGVQ